MRKIKLYLAISLNGKIARSDGSVDWLDSIPNPENSDYGYAEFYKTIDTTIMGYSTYNQVINWGIEWPYMDKKNYVLTRKVGLKNTEFVEFIAKDHIPFIEQLKEHPGKDIWLVGGGQVNTMLLNANLVDEIYLYTMPLVIPSGIDLFEGLPNETELKLVGIKSYSSGVIESIYQVENTSFKN
ncbi:MAG: dihydrofolate reductase [Saprospiraceae bacterium]|jgi:dihydrofolate reductase|nr:dihydrofolate reductase [Saprospiraceae bacterium]MBL0025794.1 dihydrofolate reductase [Saprospiraceae bacterium]